MVGVLGTPGSVQGLLWGVWGSSFAIFCIWITIQVTKGTMGILITHYPKGIMRVRVWCSPGVIPGVTEVRNRDSVAMILKKSNVTGLALEGVMGAFEGFHLYRIEPICNHQIALYLLPGEGLPLLEERCNVFAGLAGN